MEELKVQEINRFVHDGNLWLVCQFPGRADFHGCWHGRQRPKVIQITYTCHKIHLSFNTAYVTLYSLFHTKVQRQLETKASSHEGQCTPAGSSVSLLRMVLITIYVNNNHA